MANVALYRKYRGSSLDEIIGQDHIIDPLKNAIKNKRISHAYLFTGPRGVGKTSVARILAHEINNFDYADDTQYLDIIEIDAASNRRIDEIRDLRDKVHVAPAQGAFKVYIIDEVHMLTREAFNALLKTLEEPPAHAVFILATTEAHKIPATILSRTQQHTFRLIPNDLLTSHLQMIAGKEKINVDEHAVGMIAKHGGGSFRDSISLLDQVASISNDTITVETITNMVGLARETVVSEILQAVQSGDKQHIVDSLNDIRMNGTSIQAITDQLISYAQQQCIETSTNTDTMIALIDDLIDVHTSPRPDLALFTTLIDHTLRSPSAQPIARETASVAPTYSKPTPPKPPVPAPKSETLDTAPVDIAKAAAPVAVDTPEPAMTDESPVEEAPSPAPVESPIEEATAPKQEKAAKNAESAATMDEETWQNFLEAIKKSERSLHATLRMAVPDQQDDTVTLRFRFPIHQRRVADSATSKKVASLLSDHLGRDIELSIETDKDIKVDPILPDAEDDTVHTPPQSNNAHSDAAKNVLDAFGGGEVVSL